MLERKACGASRHPVALVLSFDGISEARSLVRLRAPLRPARLGAILPGMEPTVKIIRRSCALGTTSRTAPIVFALCRTASERGPDFPPAAAA